MLKLQCYYREAMDTLDLEVARKAFTRLKVAGPPALHHFLGRNYEVWSW